MTSADERAEEFAYVKMLQPQADEEHGKLMIGQPVMLPQTKARRWVEYLGIAEYIERDEYDDLIAKIKAFKDAGVQSLQYPKSPYTRDQMMKDQSALANNPGAFDPSFIPRKDETNLLGRSAAPFVPENPNPTGPSLEAALASMSGPAEPPMTENQQTPATGAKSTKKGKAEAPAPTFSDLTPDKTGEDDDGDD